MKKGFFYIAETIIIGLLIFAAIFRFTNIAMFPTDWETMKLAIQSKDLLFCLDRTGIDWFNFTEVNSTLSSLLPQTMLYTLTIENTIKPKIKAGCICGDTQFNEIKNILKNITINKKIEFDLEKIEDISFSHDYDVIIIIGQQDLSGYRDDIERYLKAGKGIIEIRDFANSNEIDTVQTEIFGIEWNESLSPNSNEIGFSSSLIPENDLYPIKKFFYYIPIFTEDFENGNANWVTVGTWIVNDYYEGFNDTEGISLSYYNKKFSGPYRLRINLSMNANSDADVIMGYKDENNYIRVEFNESNDRITVFEIKNGNENEKAWTTYPLLPSIWYSADISLIRNNTRNLIKVRLERKPILESRISLSFKNTNIGVGVKEGTARFDNLTLTYDEIKTFENFLTNEKISAKNPEHAILVQKSTDACACVINNMVEGKGRTAWLSQGMSQEEKAAMINSLVFWTAGDVYHVIKTPLKKLGSGVMFKAFNKDMPEIVKIILQLGYSY